MREVELLVIGAGSAGMTAALYAKRQGLDVLLVDAGSIGGTASGAPLVENYLGTGKISGKELMARFAEQLREAGVEAVEDSEVEKIERKGAGFEASTGAGKIRAKAVILATGSEHRKLGVEGEERLLGRGVSYCVTCDGPFFKGKSVAIVGGGNSGAAAALFMSGICKKVYLIEYAPQLMCEDAYMGMLAKSSVETITNAETTEILGKEKVSGLKLRDRATKKERTLEVDGVFIYVGLDPNAKLAAMLSAELEKGYVKVDLEQRSSVEGLFAAGDVTQRTKQLCVACGDGCVAALSAYRYIRWRK